MNKERISTGDKHFREVSLPGTETVVRQPREAVKRRVRKTIGGERHTGSEVMKRRTRTARQLRQGTGEGPQNNTVAHLKALQAQRSGVHQPGRRFGPPPRSFAYKGIAPWGSPGARAGGLDGSERVAIYSRRRRGGMPLRELTPRQAKRIRKWQTRHGGFGVQ